MSFPIVFKWATAETNYPAGGNPWDATPVNVAPVGDIFTPNTKPGAQNLNYVLNKMGATSAAILATLGTAQFFPTYTPLASDFVAYQAVSYDPLACKWLVAGRAPTTGFVTLAAGRGVGGADWSAYAVTAIGTGVVTGVCRGIEPGTSPANKYAYVAYWDTGSTAGFLERWDTSANTFSNIALPQTSNVNDIQVASVSGVVIVAVGDVSAGNSAVQYTTNSGGSFTTVINPSVSVPTGWLVAQQSPGLPNVMVIPKNAGGSYNGPTAGLDVNVTVDGTTWVHTVVSSLLASTEVPQSLCWGQDSTGAGCWILTTNNSGTPAVYRSYNGTSWTALTSNLSSLQQQLWGMQAIGSLFVAQVKESGSARLLFSYDGAVTWQCCNTANPAPSGSLQLAGGTNSFMALSSTIGLTPSFAYGPAQNLGA